MNTAQERQQYTEANAGKYFQHIDGGLYQFQGFVRYTDRQDEYAAVYLHIWPFESEQWIRPIGEWQPERFKLIADETANTLKIQNPELARRVISQRRKDRKEAATKVSSEAFNGESSI